MSKLLDYLNVLDQDATERAAFEADPQAAMTSFGLNSPEQTALLSGDRTAIANLAGVDADTFSSIQLVTPPFN